MQTTSFIFDYPNSLAAFAKLKSENNKFAERFELYIAGIELANGFSELWRLFMKNYKYNPFTVCMILPE